MTIKHTRNGVPFFWAPRQGSRRGGFVSAYICKKIFAKYMKNFSEKIFPKL